MAPPCGRGQTQTGDKVRPVLKREVRPSPLRGSPLAASATTVALMYCAQYSRCEYPAAKPILPGSKDGNQGEHQGSSRRPGTGKLIKDLTCAKDPVRQDWKKLNCLRCILKT
eukprot:1014954-Pelagomonas_calceolata.AAC.1